MDRIDIFILLGYITQLEAWAPTVLAQGRRASKADLLEIVRLRAIVDREVPIYAEMGDPAPFFAMLRADRACVPVCSTLLYLSRAEVEAVVKGLGLSLNPLSWYGIHLWESTETLPSWQEQAEGKRLPIDQAEAVRAMLSLWEERGREWGNVAFVHPDGSFRQYLEEDTLSALLGRVLEQRRGAGR